MLDGHFWEKALLALLIYAAFGVVFWAAVSVILAESRRLALLVNLAICLFLLIFYCLYKLIHQSIRDYTVYLPYNEFGDKFDGRNVVALVLAAVFTYVIVRLYYDWLDKK